MNALRAVMRNARGLSFVGAPSPLYAKLIERHGFDGVYLSGAVMANSVFGVPDDGTITLLQVAGFATLVCGATHLPVICDVDTGFTDEGDISECVRTMEDAGVAGIHFEDQISAKKCGHLDDKQLVPRDLMIEKIRSAVRARRNSELVLIARTDARGVTGFDDALDRARAYRAAGADMAFPDALHTAEEFRRFAEGCPGPLMANMTEFGKSELLPRELLAEFGYTVVIFPVTLTRLMLATADAALTTLKREGTQRGLVPEMWSRKQLYDLLEYDHPVPQPPAAD
jgi:methylisocitrate lyase